MTSRPTPQTLDPMGGITGQYFAVVSAAIAVAVAVVQVARHPHDIVQPQLQSIALLLFVAAAAVVIDGVSARRYPFGAARHAAVYALGLLAVFFDCASRAAGDGLAAVWAPVSLAILLLLMGSYRPAPEILALAGVASFAVATILVSYAAGLNATDLVTLVIGRTAPIAAVGLGSAAFSRTLVRRLLDWQNARDERSLGEREAMRDELMSEIWRDRQDLIEHRAGPFLQDIVDRGAVTVADGARARGLASALRKSMLDEASRSWLDDLADEVTDPESIAEGMSRAQRTALGGLLSELRGVSSLVPGSVRVDASGTSGTSIPTAKLVATAEFSGDPGRSLRTAAYLAVMRSCFRTARVDRTETGIRVEVGFDLPALP